MPQTDPTRGKKKKIKRPEIELHEHGLAQNRKEKRKKKPKPLRQTDTVDPRVWKLLRTLSFSKVTLELSRRESSASFFRDTTKANAGRTAGPLSRATPSRCRVGRPAPLPPLPPPPLPSAVNVQSYLEAFQNGVTGSRFSLFSRFLPYHPTGVGFCPLGRLPFFPFLDLLSS